MKYRELNELGVELREWLPALWVVNIKMNRCGEVKHDGITSDENEKVNNHNP